MMMISSLDGGGSEQQTLMLAKHLDRDRFAPELLVLRRGGVLEPAVPADVPIHCLTELAKPTRIYWPGSVHRAQVKALARLLTEREVDVVYDRTFHMSLIASPACDQVQVPRVSTIVSPPSFAVPLNAGRFVWIKRRRLAEAYRKAARVIAVSYAVASDARKYYGLRRGIDVVLNPVDLDKLRQQALQPVTLPNISRFTMVCVGRMSAEKGQKILLDALAHLKSQVRPIALPQVVFVGDGPLRGRLEQQALALGIAEDVIFAGHISVAAPHIANADLLVLPSLFEGFPNVVLEAMALKTPVLAADIPVIRQFGRIGPTAQDRGHDCVATFECGNAVSLSMKIQSVQLNSTARRSRVKAAERLIETSLSLQSQLPRLENYLLQAAAASESHHVSK